MDDRRRLSFCLLIVLLVTAGAVATAGTATSSYQLSIPGSIDTPPREVTIEDKTHTVTSVKSTAPGDTVAVTVQAPAGESYQVDLYNGDRQIVTTRSGTGGATLEFDTTGFDPGSYLVVIYKNGAFKDIHPLVVRGYDVTIDAPPLADRNAEITVHVDLTKQEAVDDPSAVEVVLATADRHVRATAKRTGTGTYAASISLSQFAADAISAYAVVRGQETAFKDGENELIGVSTAATITVSDPTPTATASPVPSATSSPTATATHRRTATPTPTTTPTASPTATATATASDAVITPRSVTTTATEPANIQVDGFGAVGALAAVAGAILLHRRRD